MEVLSQAPQPTIKCFHSVDDNGNATKLPYQEFTPTSSYISGKNLQSYNFENSLENFGGSFSFTIKEDITRNSFEPTFMDEVRPLDMIVISESGVESKVDFIGVVTTVSIGGISSNLNKSVTVSGKSIEWLFLYYNINTDIKACIFQNTEANNRIKIDLANRQATAPITIKDIAETTFKEFKERTEENKEISNFAIGGIIDLWYKNGIFETTNDQFLYPISSNLFDTGKVNFIDFIQKILPKPIYEIFGFIDDFNNPKIAIRKVPFDKPVAKRAIKPVTLTDFTLTRTCDEVYTAFMPYIEGSSQSPDFYLSLNAAENNGKIKGYNLSDADALKTKIYGNQLLTCSFVGYTLNEKDNTDTFDVKDVEKLVNDMSNWFGHLDDMYNGDFTLVNITSEQQAKIGEWISFAQGLFYINTSKHTWNYGDNPMINYQVSRGGKYINGIFKRLESLSAAYREFD
ncbi:hypothetical protein [Methanobrevibacter sp.]|uniref:hypothetical protein n=1 Tax=Methanobrevibacter sp. TaxID=66852 RepID=UPI00388D058E